MFKFSVQLSRLKREKKSLTTTNKKKPFLFLYTFFFKVFNLNNINKWKNRSRTTFFTQQEREKEKLVDSFTQNFPFFYCVLPEKRLNRFLHNILSLRNVRRNNSAINECFLNLKKTLGWIEISVQCIQLSIAIDGVSSLYVFYSIFNFNLRLLFEWKCYSFQNMIVNVSPE